jgi:hypothetical protein
MKFTDANARDWLFKTGIELASDCLYEDGGTLIYYAKSHKDKIDEEHFRKIIKTVLWWDDEDIDSAVIEIKKLTAFI